ncbi:MAG: aldehyde ferredoxin oxidoreductase family protein [Bacteroidales bacterium]
MFNKIALINLTDNKIEEITLPDDLLRDYLGGRGLGVKLFTDRVSPEVDPLSPGNLLVFAAGPVTGSSVPTAGRLALVTKSPLTGTIFYSNTGGKVGPMMKKCGIDGFILAGSAKEPVYLVIDGETGISIKPAGTLWGMDTEQTRDKLDELEGSRSTVLMIGPAGEKQVLISAVMNDAERAFGRGGVGAIMGSKMVKAIVVKNGKQKTPPANPELLKEFTRTALDKIKVVPVTRAAYPLFGTASCVNVINSLGMLPHRNFAEGWSDQAHLVSGEAIRERILQKPEACFGCSIACGRKTAVGGEHGKGPEYETVWALGPDLGIFDLETITKANYMCNRLGLDTISVGGTIACAMELAEKGLIDQPDLRFGHADNLVSLVRSIGMKEGFGVELGEGSKRLSERYGEPGASIQVKGLELPAYDPRGAMGHALGYATSNRGGCHLTGYMAAMEVFAAPKKIPRFTIGGKADLLVLKQNQSAVEDSLVTCKFAGFAVGFDFMARFVTAITGEDFNITRLLEIGERIYNLERVYNVAAGFARGQDTLPPRFLEKPLSEGLSKDQVVPLERMLNDYYAVRQWDDRGIPKKEHLLKLGLTP